MEQDKHRGKIEREVSYFEIDIWYIIIYNQEEVTLFMYGIPTTCLAMLVQYGPIHMHTPQSNGK